MKSVIWSKYLGTTFHGLELIHSELFPYRCLHPTMLILILSLLCWYSLDNWCGIHEIYPVHYCSPQLLNEEPTSLEHVKKSDVFPKKTLVSEDERLRVPFPLLSGESAEYLGRSTDGIIVLTNFRLLVRYVDSFINVPLGLIESVEIRDIFYLHIYCKDATVVRYVSVLSPLPSALPLPLMHWSFITTTPTLPWNSGD